MIRSAREVKRIRSLAIPPAWKNVWICPRPDGHLQATGIDAKGRKQYKYHPDWRTVRDEAKYERVMSFARNLPKMAVHLWLTGYHFLRYLYFYRMLHRHNAGAISVRVNLSKFRAKEKDLRGIVDPQEQSDKGTGRSIRRARRTASQVEAEREFP